MAVTLLRGTAEDAVPPPIGQTVCGNLTVFTHHELEVANGEQFENGSFTRSSHSCTAGIQTSQHPHTPGNGSATTEIGSFWAAAEADKRHHFQTHAHRHNVSLALFAIPPLYRSQNTYDGCRLYQRLDPDFGITNDAGCTAQRAWHQPARLPVLLYCRVCYSSQLCTPCTIEGQQLAIADKRSIFSYRLVNKLSPIRNSTLASAAVCQSSEDTTKPLHAHSR